MTLPIWKPALPAISLWQPYASAIPDGHKNIETRDWAPPTKMLNQDVVIQAAKRKIRPDEFTMKEMEAIFLHAYNMKSLKSFVLGVAVAVVKIVAVYRVGWNKDDGLATSLVAGQKTEQPINWDHFGNFGHGRMLWLLDDIRPIDIGNPPALKGRQGFWYLTEEEAEIIHAKTGESLGYHWISDPNQPATGGI